MGKPEEKVKCLVKAWLEAPPQRLSVTKGRNVDFEACDYYNGGRLWAIEVKAPPARKSLEK
jgi:hypothetical protein